MKKILVYGYGNPGRQDDALANQLVDMLQDWIQKNKIEGVATDSNYQLNIEDAEIISHYDIVFFADASTENINDVLLTEVMPNNSKVEFSMHAVSPAYVLDLCGKMYNKTPKTFLLHIKGYEWEFMEEMTENAKANLGDAFSLMKYKILGLLN